MDRIENIAQFENIGEGTAVVHPLKKVIGVALPIGEVGDGSVGGCRRNGNIVVGCMPPLRPVDIGIDNLGATVCLAVQVPAPWRGVFIRDVVRGWRETNDRLPDKKLPPRITASQIVSIAAR